MLLALARCLLLQLAEGGLWPAGQWSEPIWLPLSWDVLGRDLFGDNPDKALTSPMRRR
jgi:hypothetical protein